MSDVVALGVVHNGMVAYDWHKSVCDFIVYDFGRALEEQRAGRWAYKLDNRGPYIAASRNGVVRTMLEQSSADWLWFLDIDMTWEPDTLERLMELADKRERPVVAALYVTEISPGYYEGDPRLAPRPVIAPTWTGEGEDGERYIQILGVPDVDIVPLTSCGMGCTLIHRSVLELVGQEHAHDEWPWFAHDLVGIQGRDRRLGEDVTFCYRLNEIEAGLIWGAPQVRCSHFKQRVLTAADATPYGPSISTDRERTM